MKRRAYLDIETTGLSRYRCELTVIGIGLEKGRKVQVIQLIEKDITGRKLSDALSGVDEIYTYNGSRFDIPFIKTKLGVDLKKDFKHTDLMYKCWEQNLKGGLKVVERKLGIGRDSVGIDGLMAVRLWLQYYNSNDKQALKQLLDYNADDVVNLKMLRLKLQVD